MAARIKKGDMVVVIAGDDKGKTGEILTVNNKLNKVIVQGVNRVYRHMRPTQKNPQGGRIQKEMPINASNVMPIDPETSQPTRVRFETSSDGSKQRIAIKSGKSLGVVAKAK
ncbi:MAG: 50S ribosomal protein L24 [Phycisphaerales bacterium]|jgi:large subunit ribosomal protein L24|nr:50S ribosomal protein L24 [Phycisphaerales bacterium]MBT7171597.1 50S ribosomal protein L24 [Phycisphaerales bacterium]